MVAISFILEHQASIMWSFIAANIVGWTTYVMRNRHKNHQLAVVPKNITPIVFEPSEATFTPRRQIRNGRLVPYGNDAS